MQNDSHAIDTGSGWKSPGLWLLLILTLGNFFGESPLEILRPTAAQLRWRPESASTPSRVWEDPLDVAYRAYHEAVPEGGESIAGKFGKIPLDNCRKIFVVHTPGGGYAEDRESRIRARYALASAMLDSGYRPESAESVHVFQFKEPEGANQEEHSKKPETHERQGRSNQRVIPFEWYASDPDSVDQGRLLVLWIDELQIDGDILDYHRHLLDAVAMHSESPTWSTKEISVSIIGPTDSKALKDIVIDRPLPEPDPNARFMSEWRDVVMYSPWATADFGHYNDDGKSIHAYKIGGLPIYRTIGTDDELAHQLLREIRLRLPDLMPLGDVGHVPDIRRLSFPGAWRSSEFVIITTAWISAIHSFGSRLPSVDNVDPVDGEVWRGLASLLQAARFVRPRAHTRIAIVHEQDTVYGERWRDEIDKKVVELERNLFTQLGREYEVQCDYFTYLRGFDGETPGRSGSLGANGSADGTEDGAEYPAGYGQFDYVRRLQQQLTEHSRFSRLFASWTGESGSSVSRAVSSDPYQAVIVLGSDVYDKLLILQALVPTLPDALYLTTDLDARLYAEKHSAFTRNLIVASHFGLQPEQESHQFESAHVFRDCYQTSLYLALRRAVSNEPPIEQVNSKFLGEVIEIGHSGPIACETGHEDGERERESPEEESPELAPATGHTVYAGRGDERESSPPDSAGAGLFTETVGWLKSSTLGRLVTAVSPWNSDLAAFCYAIVLLAAACFWMSPWSLRLAKVIAEMHLKVHAAVISLALLLGLAVLLFVLCEEIQDQARSGMGEPLAYFDGVCVWPSVFIKILGCAFCLFALLGTILRLRQNQYRIESSFLFGKHRRRVLQARRRMRKEGKGVWRHSRLIPIWVINVIELLRWRHSSIQHLWHYNFAIFEYWPLRLARALAFASIFYWLVSQFFFAFGIPSSPARGELAYIADKASSFFFLYLLFVLIFYILDSILVCTTFVQSFMSEKLKWPRNMIESVAPEALKYHTNEQVAVGQLRVELAQDVARVVQNLVYYPTIAICILLIARMGNLERWGWPPALNLTLGFVFVLTLAGMWRIASAANEVRTSSIESLQKEEFRLAQCGKEREHIGMVIDRIAAMKDGIFAPLSEHPLVRAALLPLATLGSATLYGHLQGLPF